MSRVSKKITNWLYTVLQPQYTHTEATYRDVYRFLLVYLDRGFKIRTAVYTSALGGSDLLLNLYGPLSCGENVFQINIWVPLNYPIADATNKTSNIESNGVPIVYIVPSKGQIIRPGNNVDSQGKVYHPFLVQWYTSTSSGNPLEQFNLLLLMDCLVATFERSVPVILAPQTTGPALPPKPSNEVISPQRTGGGVSTTGPPLPRKPASSEEQPNSIPLKYRAPLPLPTQVTPSQWGVLDTGVSQASEGSKQTIPIPLTNSNGIDHKWPKYESRASGPLQNPIGSLQQSSKHRRKAPNDNIPAKVSSIEDLMDQVTLESKKQGPNPVELQRIAQHINLYLNSGSTGSVNEILPKINKTRGNAAALHSQLSHHNNQAKANIDNLENHVQYLTKQVDSIGQLNNHLYELSEANKTITDEIVLNVADDRKLALDDLVLPDLILVRQLYDTVAEIGGYRDAIKLVGGSYKSEAELINNETIDSCVRSVRALLRELFWLEVTRDEIGRVMGLEK